MDADLKDFLISHSLEGIIITDLEGNILECNRTVQTMLGHSGSALERQFIGLIFPPQSVSYLLPNILHLIRSGQGFDGELILVDSEGENVMVRMTARRWPEESPSIMLLRFLDWRDTHRIMNQLRESNQMAILGMVTRSLAHEILNPVSVIGGYTRRILESLPPGSKQEEWARQVTTGIEKLESIIDTLQTFLDLPPPTFEKGSLYDLVEASINRVQGDVEEKGICIKLIREEELPPIFMDPSLLGMAFSAVLLNAADRMPKGGEITLRLACENDRCRIRVTDSGPLPSALQMEEDLSPVHIIGANRAHLNLAIARRIVDEHGGSFDVGTSGDKGLKVIIDLPVDRRSLSREREM